MTQAAGAIAAGIFLNNLTNNIRTIIDDARNAGETLQMQAGQEVGLAIDYARNAYIDSLDQTISQVDATVRAHLQQLDAMVQQAQNHNAQTLAQLTTNAQTFINTIPSAGLFPQLTTITPRFVVKNTSNIELTFTGNFPNAAQENFTPTFTLNGHSGHLVDNQTQTLRYTVPPSVLYSSPTSFSANYGELKFPRGPGGLFGIGALSPYMFKVSVHTLPVSPGAITLFWTTTEKVQEKGERFTSPEFWQCSARSVTHRDITDKLYTVKAQDGYKVRKGTSQFTTVAKQRRGYQTPKGDWDKSFVGEDDQTVRYKVTTRYRGHRRSGDVTFKISFDQYREWTKQTPHQESLPCSWGQEIVRTLPANTNPRIQFAPFDHTALQHLTVPTLNHRFITVRRQGDDLHIRVKSPHQIA